MAKYTTRQIVEQFKQKHGTRYDYSQVEYVGDGTKVMIICHEHGEFWQTPSCHKQGQKCRQCYIESIKPKYMTEQIVERFKAKHGDKFDYSLVCYVNSTQKVKIICRIHGVFEQLVNMHCKGQGCAECMHDARRSSREKVIHQFIEIHGNIFDYSLVRYVNQRIKVKIICSEHGIFEQSPTDHLSGKGCQKCSGRGLTAEEVIADFRKTHGDKFDYSQVNFELMGKKVKIVCPEHGVFEQKPCKHKSGAGCPRCASTYKPTNFQIIEQFKQTHGSYYDYSLVKYINIHEKVEIICPEHGIFEQTPSNHKRGQGCPQCFTRRAYNRSNYIEVCQRHQGQSYLYVIKCTGNEETFYKVGIAAKGARHRFNSHTKLPYSFEIIREIRSDAGYIWDLEMQIHKLLKQYHYLPNLVFGGSVTECFSQIPDKIIKLLDQVDISQQMQLIA